MKTKLLITFERVAKLKSFSAAAVALNTVQPAISRQISDLEDYLDVKLFWRTTREVKLTPAGRVLLIDAAQILKCHAIAEQRVRMASKGQVGHLKIGYLESASYRFLPDIVRRFLELYPDVQISLDIMTAREQIDAFQSGRIDIGFSRPLPQGEYPDIGCHFIYNDSLVAFVPTNHPLAGRKIISLRGLQADNFIQFKRAGAKTLFDTITASCLDAGFSPKITNEPSAMQTVLTMVASGLGVSVAPSCIRYLYSDGCVCLPLKDALEPIALEVHYDRLHENTTVNNFLEILHGHSQTIRTLMSTFKA